MSEYLRLLAATVLVLVPGRLVAAALGQGGAATTLAWALAALFAAWAVTFVVHGSIVLVLVLLGAMAAVAAVAAVARGRRLLPRRRNPHQRVPALVLAGGLLLGLLLWHVAGAVTGDGLFHLARVRKLVDLGDLHLRTVDEFRDGGLHPGYAFPLWHGFDAVVAKLSGLDPAVVARHEASVLAPLACLVAWEAGAAVFGSAAGGLAVLAGQLGLYVFAAGHGGSWVSLSQPGTAARQLVVPAALALFFGYLESRRWPDAAALAAAFGALALVHVTYALFALIPLAAYAVVRLGEWRASAIALAAAAAPAALVVLWVRPLADETLARNPGAAQRAGELAKYAGQLDVWSIHRFRITPELLGRAGPVAVAALLLVPLAALAARRRWSAFVLGGTVAILALMLVPTLFVRFSDVVSLSQARRAAGFVPFAFAFAGGLALLGRSRLVIPAALAAGIAAELIWPGDFAYGLRHGGPALATWIAFVGGIAGIAAGIYLRRYTIREWHGRAAVAAALFVLPDRGARLPALVGADPARPARALAEARRRAAGGPEARDRDREPGGELPHRRGGTGLRGRVLAAARREHAGEPAVRAGPRGEALAADGRSRRDREIPPDLGREERPSLSSHAVKLLLVTVYFPPAGGGGVQRPLKFATHLPELGIETHVLAPDDPHWIHRDDELPPPTLAWVHRARWVGPAGRKPAEELHGTEGLVRLQRQVALFGRRLLLPDENVAWNLTAIPAAIRIARAEKIDVVLTTSPPPSVHLVGAAVKQATGARWVADLRDSLVAHPHRDAARIAVRAKEQTQHVVARLVARRADAVVAVSEAIAAEMRGLEPHGPVLHIGNGSDFDDFAGLEYRRGDRFRITHSGSFFGKRDPRPFLTALARVDDVVARFVGDFRTSDREWAESLGLGDRLELIPFVPRRRSLELQRDSEALLLLIPEAGGRGRGVLSGKVYEYLAAERPILALVPPDGAAAALLAETGAGTVVAPDDVDGVARELAALRDRWLAGQLEGTPLSPEWRERLSRRTRVEELADLLQSLA